VGFASDRGSGWVVYGLIDRVEKLAPAVCLGNYGIRSRFERSLLEIIILMHREDHDGGGDLIASDLSSGFEPAQHRHIQVEDHDVGFQQNCQPDGFAAVSRFATDLPTFLFE